MPGPKPSPTPFLITLGFAAGVGFGWLAFDQEPKSVEAPPAVTAPPERPRRAAPQPDDERSVRRELKTLRELEETFGLWGGYAVWEDDMTEFAAWNSSQGKFADFYEVRRFDGKFSFRTIGALTRPLIDHGVRADLPFHFTETQADRERFYRENPDYDRSKEPFVKLLPIAPERFSSSHPRSRRPVTRPLSLTPGAGN